MQVTTTTKEASTTGSMMHHHAGPILREVVTKLALIKDIGLTSTFINQHRVNSRNIFKCLGDCEEGDWSGLLRDPGGIQVVISI